MRELYSELINSDQMNEAQAIGLCKVKFVKLVTDNLKAYI
jgi:hypothetical protein